MFEGFTKIQSVAIRKSTPIHFPNDGEDHDWNSFQEETTINSKLILKREFKVTYQGCTETTEIADITFSFDDVLRPSVSLAISANDGYENHRDDGQGEPITKFKLDAKLIVKLSKNELQEFLKYLNTDFCIFISCSVNNQADITLDKPWGYFEITDFEYTFLINHRDVRWYSYGVQSIANSHLQKLSIGHRGQLAQIITELSESAAEAGLIVNEDDKDLELLLKLLPDLRSALRTREDDPSADYDYANLWDRDADKFQDAIRTLPESEQKVLIEKYGELWTNIDVFSGLKWGEDKYGAIAKGFDPIQDRIEEVAAMFLNLKTLRSRKLEHILINSLIFAETIALGRTLFSKKKLFGTTVTPRFIDSKGIEEDASYFQIIIKTLWIMGKAMGLEVIKLIITFFVALAVTNENITATWIVTTGYTVFRWWRQVFIASLTPENKQHILLDKMIQVHKLSSKYHFDPSHLKNQLNEVSKEGAVFSPYIFTLLDLQIERQRKS
jgi:hypothetical protein